jgi:hypothetical protein
MIITAAKTVMKISASFTSAISAGARSPLEYVYAARITNAIMSGRSPMKPVPVIPSAAITTWIPTSWSAMYGMVARIPATATANASVLLSYLPRTKSAGVT